MGFLLLILFGFLFTLPSSGEGVPHTYSSTNLLKKRLFQRMASLPNLNSASIYEKPNFFMKSSVHLSKKKNLEARYYTAVSLDTEKSHFSVSPNFLSISVSPRRIAGATCIPWDSSKLKVTPIFDSDIAMCI